MQTVPAYTGVDNLEVMEVAERYCRYLTATVTTAAGAPSAGARILDFGAGTGTIALQLAALGYGVHCVEPDPTLATMLETHGLATSPGLDGVAGDDRFDVVYSMNVLEHIEDDGGTLRAILAVLRPGGTLVLYVPAMPTLYSSMDRKVGHLRRYRRRELSRVVAQAGFDVQRSRYVDSLGFFATMAYKAFGSKKGDIGTGSVGAYDRFVFPLSRALDRVTGRTFGKNLLVYARRP